jgi:GntR family transcriptional regulator, transcriptional repressor for pyruvate dehydrogenase complex
LKPINTKRTVDIAAEAIRNEILAGKHPPGKMLPPERELSESLGISRLTLRAAIYRLETEGLLRPQQGRGVEVLDYRRTGGIDLLAYMEGDESIGQVLSLRRLFAAEAVALACESAGAAEIARLESAAARQERTEDPMRFLEGDLAFTRHIVEASGSIPLGLLFNSFERIILERPRVPMEMLQDRATACGSYRALIALVRNRDPDLARRAILGHMDGKDEERFQRALQRG